MSNTEALRAAAQDVLDRWDSPQWEWTKHGPTADLMHALRAALAQPAASGEPVATVRRAHAGGRVRSIGFQVCNLLPGANVQDGAMLYATAQPAPALVPLTDEQALEIAVTATPPGSMASRSQIVEAIRLAERHHGIFPSKENPL